jgi:L-tyrosine isonitrile synthase
MDSPLAASLDGPAVELHAVMGILTKNRRTCVERDCPDGVCSNCHNIHALRIASFIRRREPIQFVLPAFPAKSPNLHKVLGAMPDLGEELALRHLQQICTDIAEIYSPGASLRICSDGHVFADLVGLTDEVVEAYFADLNRLISESQLSCLSMYSLRCTELGEPDAARRNLIKEFGQPLEDIREAVLCDPATARLFNGMCRFVFEDISMMQTSVTRSSLRKRAKHLTYQMMQRSIAWSNLVATRFPEAVRLSIHPQSTHSEKFGIHLMSTGDDWLTPWHGVVLEVSGSFALIKRHQVSSADTRVVFRCNRPSHLEIVSESCPELSHTSKIASTAFVSTSLAACGSPTVLTEVVAQ